MGFNWGGGGEKSNGLHSWLGMWKYFYESYTVWDGIFLVDEDF